MTLRQKYDSMLDKLADWKSTHGWQWSLIVLALVIVFFFAVGPTPQLAGMKSDYVNILVLSGYFVLCALGLQIVCGFTGLLHLGFGGFACIGAFTTGILMRDYEWSFWASLPMGWLLAGIAAFAIGLPVLRLSGDYFAIVTFGFSELVVLLAQNWVTVTGGTNGFTNIPEVKFFGHEFNYFTGYEYWQMLLIANIILVAGLHRVKNSRLGRSWIAVREDELVAQCLGVNAYWSKMAGFLLSACIGSTAGAMYGVSQGYFSYENFNFMNSSVLVLICVVLGGMGSIRGAVLGGIIVGSMQFLLKKLLDIDALSWLPKDSVKILFGLMLVLLMIYRPQGIIDIRRRKRHPKPADGARGSLYNLSEEQA